MRINNMNYKDDMSQFQLNCWRVKELERSTVRLEQGQNWKRKNRSYYTWQKNFHSTIDDVKWAVLTFTGLKRTISATCYQLAC